MIINKLYDSNQLVSDMIVDHVTTTIWRCLDNHISYEISYKIVSDYIIVITDEIKRNVRETLKKR